MSISEIFENEISKAKSNRPMQEQLLKATNAWSKSFHIVSQQFNNLELARRRGAYLKWRAVENLDKYIVEFESNFQKHGGKVIWAPSATDALHEIQTIIQKVGNGKVVKSKSSVCEEIGLNEHLGKMGQTVFETDLGAYIQQLSGEAPFHLVTPAMHKTKDEIAKLFHDHLETSLRAPAAELTEVFAATMRQEFKEAAVGVVGANFLISDTGTICIVENEGNVGLVTCLPKTLIVVAGIERVLCSLNDLDTMLPLLAAYGTGEPLTAFNHLISAPASAGEEGPTDIYVILLDNGRSDLLAKPIQRQAAHCIKCGACHNVCPVFKTIGGHAYQATYNGPIGTVVMPHLKGMKDYKHLNYASTACGACTDVCPVKIDIHNLILANRNEASEMGLTGMQDKYMWVTWKKMMLKRKRMNQGNAMKGFLLKTMFKKAWGEEREFPQLAERSFNEMWFDQYGLPNDDEKII
jgi:L-lactate dehydrogenase complex protein LldF